jgi:hypothetical protein
VRFSRREVAGGGKRREERDVTERDVTDRERRERERERARGEGEK